MDTLTWYILKVTELCERVVAKRLARHLDYVQGVQPSDGTSVLYESASLVSFVPLARDEVRRRGHRYEIERVIFPGYLFVGFRRVAPWFHVRDIVGVRGVFAIDGAPMAVDERLIGDLMSRCASGAFCPPKKGPIQRGMRVVATSGPFRGVEGTVAVANKRDPHAHVLMEVFNKTVPARIHIDYLVSVSYASNWTIG